MTDEFLNFTHNFIYPHECVYRKGHYGDLKFVTFEDVSSDPGGVTKFGIDYTSHKSLGINGIKNLTIDQADKIYWNEWIKYGCDKIDGDLKFAFSNCCTNCGFGRAEKLIKDCNNASVFLEKQDEFYEGLVKSKPSFAKFLKGWKNRTDDLRKFLKID